MPSNVFSTLVALAEHMGAYSHEQAGVMFLVPGEFYPDGKERRFTIPADRYRTRRIRKGLSGVQGVFADRYYCLAHSIPQIRTPHWAPGIGRFHR